MGRVLTNNLSLACAAEEAIGVLPATPSWKLLEPNTINNFGAAITTVARSPISRNRQRQKGTITDLDSAVEFAADLTLDSFLDFIEAFCFAALVGPPVFTPTAVVGGGSSGYTVASGGALAEGTLVFARGFANAANNGLKVVAADSTAVLSRVDGLVEETGPPANVQVEVCGVQGVTSDITVNAGGNLTATALDFTTLDLTVGQSIWVGGEATATRFAEAANRGFARITAIAANLLTLDKKSQDFTEDDGSGKTIHLYFGRFCRNVAVDDGDYLERSYHFEAAFPNLEEPGPGDEYEYAKGNFCNRLSFELPLAGKAALTLAFIGTDTEPPSTTRADGADSPIVPLRRTAFNTSADIARLRVQQVDETGLSTDFKSLTLTLANNVSPEKVIGLLGAKYVNAGVFEVGFDGQLLFSNPAVAAAIRDNETVGLDFAVRNEDGAILIDLPSLTLGGGGREYPVNESVLINVTGAAFEDQTLGTSLGVSLFPFAPAS